MTKTKPPVYKERHEQRMFVKWFYLQYPSHKLAAFVNGFKRTPLQSQLLIYDGMLPGIPDIVILAPRGQYGALFIEMKRSKGGIVSEAQEAVIAHLNANGYKACVCEGFDAARQVTTEYMNEPGWIHRLLRFAKRIGRSR